MINNYKKFGLHIKCNKYKVCDNPNGSTFSFEGCIIESSLTLCQFS